MAGDNDIPGLRSATIDEAPAVTRLINGAFAPEINFRDGPRTNSDALRQYFEKGRFFVVERDAQLIACVYVELRGERGYIGMLAVDPALQGQGMGRKLMNFAEAYLKRCRCALAELLIVNANSHLLNLYSKFGYQETGTAPYPPEIPTKFPVHFIRMEKQLL